MLYWAVPVVFAFIALPFVLVTGLFRLDGKVTAFVEPISEFCRLYASGALAVSFCIYLFFFDMKECRRIIRKYNRTAIESGALASGPFRNAPKNASYNRDNWAQHANMDSFSESSERNPFYNDGRQTSPKKVANTANAMRFQHCDASVSQRDELERQIDDTERAVREALSGSRRWKDVWPQVRATRESLREAKKMSPDDWELVQPRFQCFESLMLDVERQAGEFRQRQADVSRASANHVDQIVDRAESGRPVGSTVDNMLGPAELLADACIAAVTLGLLSTPAHEPDQRKQELLFWSQKLREAWDQLKQNKTEMRGSDKSEVYKKLLGVQADLDAAWQEWRSAKQQRRESSRAEWRTQAEEQIGVLESRIESLSRVAEQKEEHLSVLEARRDGASNDHYRERVEQWIEQETTALQSIRAKIDRLTKRLEDKRERLDQ